MPIKCYWGLTREAYLAIERNKKQADDDSQQDRSIAHLDYKCGGNWLALVHVTRFLTSDSSARTKIKKEMKCLCYQCDCEPSLYNDLYSQG